MPTTSFGSANGITNSTATVTAVPAPSSGVMRIVRSFKIMNADPVDNSVIFSIVDGVNTRDIYNITLSQYSTLQASEGDLDVLDTTSKSVAIRWANAPASVESAWEVSWADQS